MFLLLSTSRQQSDPRAAHRSRGRLAWLTTFVATCLASLFALCEPARAQPAPEGGEKPPLITQDPFDQITLNDADGRPVVMKIQPLNLPNGTLPANPNEVVPVRLVDRPDEQFEVTRGAIRKYERWEQIVLAEVERFISQGKLDIAFRSLEYLWDKYPGTPNLEAVTSAYLYLDAGRLFQAKRYDEALAILDELYRRDPDYRYPGDLRSVLTVLEPTIDRLLESYMSDQKYVAARRILNRVKETYGEKLPQLVERWEARLVEVADSQRVEIERLLNGGKFREARAAARRMLETWPSDSARALVADLERRYPLVVVGVSQPARSSDPRSIDDWAARRVGRLTHRTLFEFSGHGPEGGKYESPLGSVTRSDDGLQLTFQLRESTTDGIAPNVNGYDLAQFLMSLADPDNPNYLPAFAALEPAVRVNRVVRVELALQRSHVLPQALLQVPLRPAYPLLEPTTEGLGPYVVAGVDSDEVSFAPNPRYQSEGSNAPPSIVETHIDDAQAAVSALLNGEIDMIDRISPWSAQRLQREPQITVARYDLPLVHVLVPNLERPYMASRTFRRALVYAIDREVILNTQVLRGAAVPDCSVVSGPFLSGIEGNAAIGYAYDESLPPLPYEPALAATLVQLAERELEEKARLREEPAPKREPLVLAHPGTEVARIAAQSIALQWQAIGIECQTKELPPGATTDPKGEADLLYVEVPMWEPVVDARRLLEPADSAYAAESPFVRLALRQLDGARDWQQASLRLHELHRVTYAEMTVLPLWQMVDYFAYRKSLQGVSSRPLTLYETAADWRLAAPPAGP